MLASAVSREWFQRCDLIGDSPAPSGSASPAPRKSVTFEPRPPSCDHSTLLGYIAAQPPPEAKPKNDMLYLPDAFKGAGLVDSGIRTPLSCSSTESGSEKQAILAACAVRRKFLSALPAVHPDQAQLEARLGAPDGGMSGPSICALPGGRQRRRRKYVGPGAPFAEKIVCVGEPSGRWRTSVNRPPKPADEPRRRGAAYARPAAPRPLPPIPTRRKAT
mmetsp:Transcript_103997/g.238107  ORF Transcript_103997/g.238107 Transcript_103997/m.238107 type:complete len:218 (+) Transcript_103997:22-675(+)